MKEIGLSHEEIFGETRYINRVEKVERSGWFGEWLDDMFGEKKVEKTEKVKTPGMSLTCFQAYLDLYEEFQKEKKQERKKQKMRQKLKTQSIG